MSLSNGSRRAVREGSCGCVQQATLSVISVCLCHPLTTFVVDGRELNLTGPNEVLVGRAQHMEDRAPLVRGPPKRETHLDAFDNDIPHDWATRQH